MAHEMQLKPSDVGRFLANAVQCSRRHKIITSDDAENMVVWMSDWLENVPSDEDVA